MAVDDYDKYRMVSPSKFDRLEDLLSEFRLHATAELYEDEPEDLVAAFAHGQFYVRSLIDTLTAVQDDMLKAFKVREQHTI
jgi:hypothetical protein